MPERFTITKTEDSDNTPDYIIEEAVTGKLLNDLSDTGKNSIPGLLYSSYIIQ